MKKSVRIMSVLLSFVIASSMLLSGCGNTSDDGGDPSNTTDVSPETSAETTSEEDARLSAKDDVPALNFNGADFRIWTTDRYEYEMYVEELTGDICNDAVFERNQKIEERFNINIKTIVTNMDAADDLGIHPKLVTASIMSGEDEFELVPLAVWKSGPFILNGMLQNWSNVKYVNFSQPWWPEDANKCFNVGGKQYIVVSDLSVTTLQLTYAFLFNKQLADNYKLEDMYTVVDEGRWTVDYLAEVSANVYTDLNGDSTRDEGDLYGYVGDLVTGNDAWLPAFNQPLITPTANGGLELSINTEKTIVALEKINDLYYNNPGGYVVNYWEKYDMFKANKALFTQARLITLYDRLREMDVDFGVIPYPKFDESQDKYYSNTVDNYSVLCIPVTSKNTDMTGAIVEALSCESYRTVIPAFYDIALGTKYTRDERSTDMLDLIMDGRNYDISIVHNDSISRLAYFFRDLVVEKNSDFSSKYAAYEKVWTKSIAKVLEGYQKLS